MSGFYAAAVPAYQPEEEGYFSTSMRPYLNERVIVKENKSMPWAVGIRPVCFGGH
jgi:hypothetical protein